MFDADDPLLRGWAQPSGLAFLRLPSPRLRAAVNAAAPTCEAPTPTCDFFKEKTCKTVFAKEETQGVEAAKMLKTLYEASFKACTKVSADKDQWLMIDCTAEKGTGNMYTDKECTTKKAGDDGRTVDFDKCADATGEGNIFMQCTKPAAGSAGVACSSTAEASGCATGLQCAKIGSAEQCIDTASCGKPPADDAEGAAIVCGATKVMAGFAAAFAAVAATL